MDYDAIAVGLWYVSSCLLMVSNPISFTNFIVSVGLMASVSFSQIEEVDVTTVVESDSTSVVLEVE